MLGVMSGSPDGSEGVLFKGNSSPRSNGAGPFTLRQSNRAMGNPPFEDVSQSP